MPLKILPKESSALVGKDLTKLHHGKGKEPTTLRHQTSESCSIHGTLSTYGSTTSRDDDVESNIHQSYSLFLDEFLLHFPVFHFTI